MLNFTKLTYISLGSNSGNSGKILKQALDGIRALPETWLLKCSKIYLTEPQDDPGQAWFYNQVCAVSTNLQPGSLLEELQSIETRFGRIRDPGRRFGPRTLDLDILMYGRLAFNSPKLILPHPRMSRRAFVLIPLLEIADEELRGELAADLQKIEYRLDGNRIYQN
jgi:2-amino-4-hydroxy-6-hydroxymethyldihydropteridine diphosphokinase